MAAYIKKIIMKMSIFNLHRSEPIPAPPTNKRRPLFTKNLNFGWAFSLKLIAGSFIVLAKHSTCFLHVHVYYVSIVLAHH